MIKDSCLGVYKKPLGRAGIFGISCVRPHGSHGTRSPRSVIRGAALGSKDAAVPKRRNKGAAGDTMGNHAAGHQDRRPKSNG